MSDRKNQKWKASPFSLFRNYLVHRKIRNSTLIGSRVANENTYVNIRVYGGSTVHKIRKSRERFSKYIVHIFVRIAYNKKMRWKKNKKMNKDLCHTRVVSCSRILGALYYTLLSFAGLHFSGTRKTLVKSKGEQF